MTDCVPIIKFHTYVHINYMLVNNDIQIIKCDIFIDLSELAEVRISDRISVVCVTEKRKHQALIVLYMQLFPDMLMDHGDVLLLLASRSD